MRQYKLGAKPLAKIPVLDKPLLQGGIPKLLSPEDYKEQFACEYSEDVTFSAGLVKQFSRRWQFESQQQPDGVYSRALVKKVHERLENPIKQLAIYFIDESVGYGVLATLDIAAGTVLCFYSGETTYNDGFTSHDASYDSQLWRGSNEGVDVSAKTKGGIVRFMQHLPLDPKVEKEFFANKYRDPQERAQLLEAQPHLKGLTSTEFSIAMEALFYQGDEKELDNFEFNYGAKASVATANVFQESVYIDGRPVNVMIATRDIKRGEPVGYCYGKKYWEIIGINPMLFAKDGALLAKACYKRLSVIAPLRERGSDATPMARVTATTFNPVQHPLFKIGPQYYQSTYLMRELFAAANAKNSESYAALDPSSFAIGLLTVLRKNTLGNIDVFTYWRDPMSSSAEDTYAIADVVCRASSSETYSAMLRFFSNHKQPIKVEALSSTKEVIIRGTNEEGRLAELNTFISAG